MGTLFKNVEDYQTALDYCQQANAHIHKYHLGWSVELHIGEIYSLMGKFDSSQYYLKRGLKFFEDSQKDSTDKKEPMMLA
jgi:hypothetical protein